MATTWQLQTAKQKISELVDRALAAGSQCATRRGRLRGPERDFKQVLFEGPPFDDLEIDRSTEPSRPVEL